jgi:hypothetical protein
MPLTRTITSSPYWSSSASRAPGSTSSALAARSDSPTCTGHGGSAGERTMSSSAGPALDSGAPPATQVTAGGSVGDTT